MATRTLSHGINGAILKLLRAGDFDLQTTAVAEVAGSMVRVGFRCPALFDARVLYPGFWLRLWFPDPGNPGRAHQRGYTVINADPEAGTFDIDFLVHEPAGPASTWAQAAEPGEHLVATLYGTAPYAPAPGGRHVLVGDLSSLPAVRELTATLLRGGKDAAVSVHLALLPAEAGRERPELDGLEGAEVTWTVDQGGGEGLVAAAATDLSRASSVWIAGASSRVRTVKSQVRRNTGLAKDDVQALAYWAAGRAMGKSAETGH